MENQSDVRWEREKKRRVKDKKENKKKKEIIIYFYIIKNVNILVYMLTIH